jgi:acetylglutamate kinase
MQQMIQRARTLHEALPYIRKFAGKTVVVKYGGHAMVDAQLRSLFARDIVLLKYVGLNPVVVHGGGPQINSMLERLSIESKFHNGIRVTNSETMEVVEMILGGKVNKEIVNLINAEGGKAVGITGKDGGLLQAVPWETDDGVDVGHVGRVDSVNPDIIDVLEDQGFIPVVAPIGVDRDGNSYNINADYVASKVAQALKAEKLVLMTDVDGVQNEHGELISVLDRPHTDRLIDQGVVRGGMIPKTDCALEALAGGVNNVHIINGTTPHALLLELFTDEGIGTMIEAVAPQIG